MLVTMLHRKEARVPDGQPLRARSGLLRCPLPCKGTLQSLKREGRPFRGARCSPVWFPDPS